MIFTPSHPHPLLQKNILACHNMVLFHPLLHFMARGEGVLRPDLCCFRVPEGVVGEEARLVDTVLTEEGGDGAEVLRRVCDAGDEGDPGQKLRAAAAGGIGELHEFSRMVPFGTPQYFL